MRPGSVEGVHICVEHTVELLLMQDQEMIEALTPYTAEESLTDGIRARGVIRSFENLDVTRLRNPSEAHPKLAVVITDEVLRSYTKGGGFPNRYVRSRRRWEIVVMRGRRHGPLCESVIQS